MKAIRVHQFGEPDVLKLEEVPDPTPGEGQIVVRVHAAGVNPVETYIRKGIYGPRDFPYTPGTDAAGLVEAVGAGVRRLKVGDRAYIAGSISGTYAEKALCKETQVFPLPPRVTFQQGAAIHVPYATAFRALHIRAKAIPGEVVLIHGATGGVGVAAVQLAAAAGMVVIGTGGTEEGRKMVIEQGAEHVVDHHDPKHMEKILELTDGRGVDVIVEMVAHVYLGQDLTILAKDGRVVVVGNRGPVQINARDGMQRDATIHTMSLMNASERELFTIHAALVAGLENGSLRPVVGTELPLAEAATAHERVMAPGSYGKIVLIPN